MKSERKIFIAFILNLGFSVLEFVCGIITGSVAILSDSIHDLGDATSIGASYLFERKSKKKPDEKYTYGYARYSVLGGLITLLILILGSCVVIYNAVCRFLNPVEIHYNGMIIVAVIGLSVNLIAWYFTHGGHSINQKAISLHLLEDVLGWAIVLVGAVVMRFTNFYLLDGILAIAVAVFVLFNTIKPLKEILDLILIKKPNGICTEKLKEHILSVEGVKEIHHLHVWGIDTEMVCATLHVVVLEYDPQIKNVVKEELSEFGITHATIEMENASENCLEKECSVKASNHYCNHHHHHH
jgi:cobalt-zinc-cadmium efflux system protein